MTKLLYKLLKACQERSRWIRIDNAPFTSHRLWPELLNLLEGHALIKLRTVSESGEIYDELKLKYALIYVVDHPGKIDNILAGSWAKPLDENIRHFFRALAERTRADPSGPERTRADP